MLGYDARVHEIRSGVGDEEFLRISQLPYAEGIDYFKTLFSRSVAYVPYRTWVDGLLKAVDAGRADAARWGVSVPVSRQWCGDQSQLRRGWRRGHLWLV
jgi:hypothetical protein